MTDFTFEGFEAANTTPVPDVLFDELLTRLSGPQLKVLLYIIRRTAGFKKSSDGISLSQFTDGIKTRDGKVLDNGCGIKKRSTVSKVLKELIAMGCVESTKTKTDMGDDAVTTYSVRFKGVVAKMALPSDETATTVVPKQPLPGSAQTATRGSANIGTHKKQLTRNSNKQETDLQEGTYDSAFATSPTHEIEEEYVPDFNYLTSEQVAAPFVRAIDQQTMKRAAGNLTEQTTAMLDALTEKQDSYSPELPASGYEKKEEENDASVSVRVATLDTTATHPGIRGTAGGSNAAGVATSGISTQAAQQRGGSRSTKKAATTKGKGVAGKISWSLEGAAFRQWWEELTGATVDETSANAAACNKVGKKASATYENTKLVVAEIRANKWVKANRVAVTPQDLANDTSNLRWEKWLQPAQQSQVYKPPTREEDPYSVAALLEEHNPGYHARKEMMARGDYSFADILNANS